MQVLLDGQPVVCARSTVGTAIQSIAEQARARGRMIVEVKIDGELLKDEALMALANGDGAGIRELALTSADPKDLVRETVLDAVDALEQVKADQAAAAEQVQQGRTEEALRTLQGAFVVWQTVRDVVSQGAAVLEVDLDTLELPGIDADCGFGPATAALLEHLGQVRSALESQDWSALSDVVGYDLDADVTTWRTLLTAFAADLEGERGPGLSAS